MNKKYVEIKVEGNVVAVCEIKDCSPLDFIQKKREAEANLKVLLDRLKSIEHEIRVLKGEE